MHSIESIQIIGSRAGGGAESFFQRLCLALRDQGHPVSAILSRHSSIESVLQNQIPITKLPMWGNWDRWSAWQIRRHVHNNHIPVVQTWMGRATRLTDLRGLTDSVHVARLGGYYNLKSYRHADAWIGNTRGICDYLLQGGLPSERVFHIGNFYQAPAAIDQQHLQQCRQQLSLDEDTLCLFTLGRLHTNKAFDTLLAALEKIGPKLAGRPYRLIIAGDGPLRDQLQQQAGRAGLQNRINWLGWQADPAPWFALADLFICPSRHEPLGNVILEAWGHRLPVISTRSQGALELISNNEDGVLVDIDEPAAMAQAIESLARDPDLAAALAEQGQQKLLREFSPEVIVAHYQSLYQDLSKR